MTNEIRQQPDSAAKATTTMSATFSETFALQLRQLLHGRSWVWCGILISAATILFYTTTRSGFLDRQTQWQEALSQTAKQAGMTEKDLLTEVLASETQVHRTAQGSTTVENPIRADLQSLQAQLDAVSSFRFAGASMEALCLLVLPIIACWLAASICSKEQQHRMLATRLVETPRLHYVSSKIVLFLAVAAACTAFATVFSMLVGIIGGVVAPLPQQDAVRPVAADVNWLAMLLSALVFCWTAAAAGYVIAVAIPFRVVVTVVFGAVVMVFPIASRFDPRAWWTQIVIDQYPHTGDFIAQTNAPLMPLNEAWAASIALCIALTLLCWLHVARIHLDRKRGSF